MPTAIHEIHDIPSNEFTSRGFESRAVMQYIPYLSMTQGEMRLALLAEQARIYAKAFPELKQYATAATMLTNALNAGVSRGVSFVGRLDGPLLQKVAREITTASRQQRPASREGFMARKSIATGIGVIPVQDRLKACLDAGGLSPSNVIKCTSAAKIEQILNDGIIKSGHHMLYKNLKSSDNLPSDVNTKKIFQQSGVEGMALVGSLNVPLMYEWVETAILNKNVQGNVGPYSSRDTSFLLGNREHIGEPITIGLITTLIVSALGAAAALLKELRATKAYAMSEAKGFGTASISANQEDWLNGGDGSSNNTLILAGAAALGIYFLTDK